MEIEKKEFTREEKIAYYEEKYKKLLDDYKSNKIGGRPYPLRKYIQKLYYLQNETEIDFVQTNNSDEVLPDLTEYLCKHYVNLRKVILEIKSMLYAHGVPFGEMNEVLRMVESKIVSYEFLSTVARKLDCKLNVSDIKRIR